MDINKRSLLNAVLALLFITAFFTVPFFFPTEEIVLSDSYDYGFNNKAGVLLVWAGVALFILMGLKNRAKDFSFFSENSPRIYTCCSLLHILCYVDYYVQNICMTGGGRALILYLIYMIWLMDISHMMISFFIMDH